VCTYLLPILIATFIFLDFQFIAQNQNDLHSWIEAINNSCSKSSTPEIEQLSPSPICFKQELLPNRELPVPPAAATDDTTAQDYYYDKPNPIIRPVNLYENGTDDVDMIESIYHFIDESKQEKDTLPKVYVAIFIIIIIIISNYCYC